MTDELPPPAGDRPRGVALLAAFLAAGALTCTLAALSLTPAGAFLAPMWRVNPEGGSGLRGLGAWGPLLMLTVGLACGAAVLNLRLAITEEQIRDYGLPSAIVKGREVVQAEALPPNDLAALVREAIEDRLDLDKMTEVRERTDKVLEATLEALRDAKLID